MTSRLKFIAMSGSLLLLVFSHGYAVNAGKKIERSKHQAALIKAQNTWEQEKAQMRAESRERLKSAQNARETARREYKQVLKRLRQQDKSLDDYLNTPPPSSAITLVWD